MEPSPRVAGKLASVSDFRQRQPRDGAPASEKTVVYTAYDDRNLYAIFVCFDSKSETIRTGVAHRERIESDDRVQLILDTFYDQRRAYGFNVNPHGIQWDGLYTDSWYDETFDTVWTSHGRMTDRGYVVLIAIPFKSLRFPPEDLQKWGVFFMRSIPRLQETDYWPENSMRIGGLLNKEARMDGMERISPGRNVQFIPYGVFRTARSTDTRDYPNYRFTNDTAFDGGVDAKFVLKDSLVLDTTINPDFSQVESDDPQITVNQRFEVYFPEKRPFFLENSNFFDTPMSLVFTRRIGDPKYGARLTGKVGKYAIGALVADDEGPGRSVAPDDPDFNQRAYFSVLRVNRDIWKESTVGMIYTDREFNGTYNRVGGADFALKLNSVWRATAQAVTSSTQYAGGGYSAGPMYAALVQRNGRTIQARTSYVDISPGFNTLSGFVNRVDIRQLSQAFDTAWWPKGKHLTSITTSAEWASDWDHRNLLVQQTFVTGTTWTFKRRFSLGGVYNRYFERLRPMDFGSLAENADYTSYSAGPNLTVNTWRKVSLTASYRWATRVNYYPAQGIPLLADSESADVGVTLRPSKRLRVDNTYSWWRLGERNGAAAVFNNHIMQSKWNWQFSRELSFRFIGRYEAVLANPLKTLLQKDKSFNADFLFTYMVHPGTAVYVGYNSNLANMDPALRPDLYGRIQRSDRFINDGRQFFVKISYLLRY